MIFFLHIPKTGGQTLAVRLASAFALNRIHILKDDLHYPADNEVFSRLVESRDFVESHVFGSVLEEQPELLPWIWNSGIAQGDGSIVTGGACEPPRVCR